MPKPDDDYLFAASANDLTGLAPTPASNEYEAESYEEVYPYLPNPHIGDAPSLCDGIRNDYRTQVTKQNPNK